MRIKWYWWLIPLGMMLVYFILTNTKESSQLSEKPLASVPPDEYQQQVVRGQVTSWEPSSGRLMLWADNKNHEIIVNPSQMKVFTISQQNRTTMLPVLETSGWRWETAFCQGDEVAATYKDNRLFVVDSAGPRICAADKE